MGYVESPSDSPGLVVKKQDRIQSFLLSASSEPGLPQDLKDLVSSLLSQDNVPYAPLRRIWFKSQPSSRPELIFLFSGCEFVFSSPKQRERSDELKARLRKLEELAERKAYQELVKDITPKREANEPFSSYKDQLGFGMHVGLVMFTGYLVGYAAFRALFDRSSAMSAAGGILGLVGGMLVETLLFIIKASDQTPKQYKSTSKIKKQ
ncbi:hypothetical protein LINPERPRIM_LOCUS34359 [Linum perenne]